MRQPDDTAARLAADWRLFLVVGTGLVIQTSHPVIGAGVGKYSTYSDDPWGRLYRSLWPVLAMVIMDDDGYGADMRAMHRSIGGTDDSGRRYHAWDAEAAFLVLGSAAYASTRMAECFGTPLTERDRESLFHGWRRAALNFGIPDSRLPDNLQLFDDWWENLITHTLEDHATAHGVLRALRHPGAPAAIPAWLWWPIGDVIGRILTLATVGTLPPVLRERLGIAWTGADERKLRTLGIVTRVVHALLPTPVQQINRVIVKRREHQMRSYVAHGAELGTAPSIA